MLQGDGVVEVVVIARIATDPRTALIIINMAFDGPILCKRVNEMQGPQV